MIKADWPAPNNIIAGTTTRAQGNIASHVGDNLNAVLQNRRLLSEQYAFPSEPVWLHQEHTDIIVSADQEYAEPPLADASFATIPGRVCLVMTADCLPILICNKQGTKVAAIHAGWRGLADGVLLRGLERLQIPPEDALVWFGPAISKPVFEVGEDVREAFLSQKAALPGHFADHTPDKYWCDMVSIAQFQLAEKGIFVSFGGTHCTYKEPESFYSYRREGTTGRMASFIFIT